jgi:cytochrome c oxidase subunit 2
MARKHAAALPALVAVALVTASSVLAGNGGVAPPDPAGDNAGTIRELYWILLAACGAVFVLVEAVLILFVVKYRRRDPAAEGPQVHGHTRLELIWTAVPAAILAGLVVVTLVYAPRVDAEPLARETGDLVIRVDAHQFYWQYEYPNGALSFDELYLPVGQKVTLELVGSDVIHSWWIPALAGKRDAIPGRANHITFRPERTGVFEGQCGEFCGIQHARMRTRARVVAPAEFDTWLAANSPETIDLAELGRAEWATACAKCHGLEGEGDVGPPIAGNGTLTDRAALKRLLYEGQNLETFDYFMPPVGRGWSDRQIDALATFVEGQETLAGAAASAGGEG